MSQNLAPPALAADAAGDAYVTGYTFSTSFPLVNPIQPYTGAGADQVFVTEFNPNGSALIYSTYLGGSDGDIGMGIALDSAGSAYVTGATASTNFPVTPGAAQTTFGGDADAFVVKIYPLLLTPTTLAFGNQPVGTTSEPLTATLTNSGLTALTISGITIVGANPTDFFESDDCGGSVAAGSSCTISVTFAPASVASFTATVNVTDSASSQPQTITLTGAGINGTAAPQAVLTPTSVAFGNQTVGTTTAARVIMLSNPPAAADFGVSSSTLPQTVQPGASAQYIIAVASASAETPFTSAVTLAASGLPPGATASFNPASVTPGASGGNSTLTVQTGGIAASRTPNSASPPGTRATHWYLTTASVAFLCIGFIRRRKGWSSKIAVLFMVAFGTLCALGLNGCGGGFALPRTSTGATYTITVIGTSGADQHSTTVTLTVE